MRIWRFSFVDVSKTLAFTVVLLCVCSRPSGLHQWSVLCIIIFACVFQLSAARLGIVSVNLLVFASVLMYVVMFVLVVCFTCSKTQCDLHTSPETRTFGCTCAFRVSPSPKHTFSLSLLPYLGPCSSSGCVVMRRLHRKCINAKTTFTVFCVVARVA